VPVFVMAMARLAAIEHAVFELGIATDRPGRGRALALSLRAQRRAIAARIAGDPVVRAFVDTGFGLPPPRASLVAGLVDDARGDPLAAGTSRALSPREIAGLHPEVYLADGSPQATLHIVRRSRAGRRMRALTEGRVLVLDPRELVPDDRAYTALRRIAAALHPEVFR
jgi:ABC-type Fe3+-hydroxamate transport system substrate-binding protein